MSRLIRSLIGLFLILVVFLGLYFYLNPFDWGSNPLLKTPDLKKQIKKPINQKFESNIDETIDNTIDETPTEETPLRNSQKHESSKELRFLDKNPDFDLSPFSLSEEYFLGRDSFWTLEFNDLPVTGYRFFNSKNQALPNPPREIHQLASPASIERQIRERLMASDCEIVSTSLPEMLWFYQSKEEIVPAHRISIHAICDRERKKEFWILSDPDLNLLKIEKTLR